jgi:hypothetical protein
MKKLLSQVTKVIYALNKNAYQFKSEDNCEDSLEYHDIGGHEVIVGDDNERQSWNVQLNDIKGAGDGKIPHDVLTEFLVGVLGPQSKVHTGARKVNNWEPSKNVLIVHFDDSIEFTQYYSKR